MYATALPAQELKELFNQSVLEISQEEMGLCFHPGADQPRGELCTVCITFTKGFRSSLTLCAERAIFHRLARQIIPEEDITPRDVEDFAKEYINILVGHISSHMFQATRIPSRFSIPAFYPGLYTPEDHQEHFVLTYTSNENEHARLTLLLPRGGAEACANG